MSLVNHLVIFAKSPRLGLVKRRLARGIGGVGATQFYRQGTARLLRRLAADGRWRCQVATTPDADAGPRTPWSRLAPGIPVAGQGGGDLGRRMGRTFHRLPPGPVVIIGADIPDIRRRHIAAAFRALGRADCVFGPAADGGYWLVGLKRRPRVPDIFGGVRWSTEHALGDTLANLGPNIRLEMLETLADIDDAAGYDAWRRHDPSHTNRSYE